MQEGDYNRMANDQDFILLISVIVLAAVLAQLIFDRKNSKPSLPKSAPVPLVPPPLPKQPACSRGLGSNEADTSIKSSEEESFIMALMEENKGS